MSEEEDKNKGLHIQKGGVVKTPTLTPKTITAQSQAKNSYARIIILGGVLALLCVALFTSIAWRPEHVKDILLVISTIAAYLAGSIDFSRKDEK